MKTPVDRRYQTADTPEQGRIDDGKRWRLRRFFNHDSSFNTLKMQALNATYEFKTINVPSCSAGTINNYTQPTTAKFKIPTSTSDRF